MSFILAFPIFLTIVVVLVQYALLANAKTAVDHAAQAAARAAMTCLPDEAPDNVKRAACMALAPLSPRATSSVAAEGSDTAEALQRCGVAVADSFAERYTYAMDATEVSWTGGNFVGRATQDIEVTVKYKFQLTVPGAGAMLKQTRGEMVGGIDGNFYTVTSTVRVQTAHGRKASAAGSGWPN